MKLRPLTIQYLHCTSVRFSFAPLWLTRWWALRAMRAVKGCFLGHLCQSCACQNQRPVKKLPHNLLATERRPTVGDMMSCEDFSSLQRLLRVTTYVDPASRLKGSLTQIFQLHWPLKNLLLQRSFGSPKYRKSWSSRRILMPWNLNLAYSSMIVEMWWPATECQHSFCSCRFDIRRDWGVQT